MESIEKKLLIEILSDQNLKKEFISNPKKVLQDKGFEIDENADYKVLEDTKNLKHLVVPFMSDADPEKGEELEKRFSKMVL